MVRVEELTFAYPGRRGGIGPLRMNFTEGMAYHIKGDSGCGKSTLARCITGIIPHLYNGSMSGDVWLGDLNTKDTSLWRLTETAGCVFQNPSLQMLGSSIEEEIVIGLENLGLDRIEIKKRLAETIEFFGLQGMEKRQPQSLSGGEQQKLALAAICARKPDVLVLDEPLSMLDITAAQNFVGLLSGLADTGTTIIIFEHRSDHLAAIPLLHKVEMKTRTYAADKSHGKPVIKFHDKYNESKIIITGLRVNINGVNILKNIDLAFDRGEFAAIVGRNGSGKTTLLRAMAGLQTYEGSITADGEKPDFGLVFQNSELQLFNPSVKKEILYGHSKPDMEIYNWLIEALGLREYEDTPPLLLSEGEKKRVALASVILRMPLHGILLDEPSLGLDAGYREMLLGIAGSISSSGRLVAVTTHDLALASKADRIILLDRDGIVADGKPGVLFADNDAWRKAGLFVPDWVRGK